MKYRHGKKYRQSRRWHLLNIPLLIFPLILTSTVTTFSLGSERANAPDNQSTLITQASFMLQGSQPRAIGESVKATATNSRPKDLAEVPIIKKVLTSTSMTIPINPSCKNHSSIMTDYNHSISPEIQKLADYETACGGSFISGSMLFMRMPADTQDAISLAHDTAIRIKEFAKYNLRPKIIMEPLAKGVPIDFNSFKNGDYDATMTNFYTELKNIGIQDSELGDLVPFPEANIPVWGNTDPETIAQCIKKLATIQKSVFPDSKISVLLDSKSYPDDTSWSGGTYASLLPFVNSIPSGLVDSFGLQGYPWPDPHPIHQPDTFLSADIAIEAARKLGVERIWFNTGTYKRGTAWNGNVYSLSPDERFNIFNNIIGQAVRVKSQGFTFEMMLFAENKFHKAEGNDWSYFATTQSNGDHTSLFKAMQAELNTRSIPLYIFDSY